MELLQIPPRLLSRISTGAGRRSEKSVPSGFRTEEGEGPSASYAYVFVYLINEIDVRVWKTLARWIPFYESEKNAAWTPTVVHSLGKLSYIPHASTSDQWQVKCRAKNNCFVLLTILFSSFFCPGLQLDFSYYNPDVCVQCSTWQKVLGFKISLCGLWPTSFIRDKEAEIEATRTD